MCVSQAGFLPPIRLNLRVGLHMQVFGERPASSSPSYNVELSLYRQKVLWIICSAPTK